MRALTSAEKVCRPTKGKSRSTCLIHGPGNSSYEYKFLGDIDCKYLKIRPTKDRGQDPAKTNKFIRKQDENAMGENTVDEIIPQDNNELSAEY